MGLLFALFQIVVYHQILQRYFYYQYYFTIKIHQIFIFQYHYIEKSRSNTVSVLDRRSLCSTKKHHHFFALINSFSTACKFVATLFIALNKAFTDDVIISTSIPQPQ